jgi:two-component system, sensor histidine kinase
MSGLSVDLFRDLVEFAPDALLLVDSGGSILYANAHAHTLFGYAAATLNGLSIEVLIPEESRPLHAAHREGYSRSPRLREMGNRAMPLLGLRRDGTRFRAEIRLAPIRTPDGFLAAAAVRDATEGEHIMSMLAAARQSAEDANEAKGRLLAAASHDLRQPLQSLRLLNEALKRLIQDPTVQDVLDQEERALSTMSDLLHALLNIAKLESGTVQSTITEVYLPTVLEDLRQQFASLARLKNVDLTVVGADVHVLTDSVLLRELLQNLLANAVRYTDSGYVTVRCIADGATRVVRVDVEDTGIGIPSELLDRIFDDFFQATPQDSQRGGAGLGLGIVRRLSKVLDLPVRVTSTVGRGTCFTIEIPTVQHAQPRAAVASTGTIATATKGKQIILVEDDRAMRLALRTYLRLDEHEVHAVGSLGELDQLLANLTGPPAIVISDFHLGLSERGSDAIDKIRKHFQVELPAILLTGDTSAVPARLVNGPGIRMLTKPVDAARLVAVMDELLRSAS